MSYATIADLRAASGDEDIADGDARALKLLEFADAKIDAYCGQSFPLTTGGEVPVVVVAVAAAMAARAWTNPSGAQSVTDTAGPSTLATSWGSGQRSASVPLALRASEKDDLTRYRVRRNGIGTIATERPLPLSAELYVNDAGGGKPFPWPDPDML